MNARSAMLLIVLGVCSYSGLIAWMQHRDAQDIEVQFKNLDIVSCDSALPRERIIEFTAVYRGSVLLRQCVYVKAPIGEPKVRM